ncbi:MAG: hypothetical protein RL181_114 [Bacteroidota bacterium]
MNRQLIFFISLLLGFSAALNAQVIQSKRAWLTAGDSAMQRKDYFAAMKFYEAALEYDTTAAPVWFKYAECARHFNANWAAEKGYVKVLQKAPAQFPEARLWLGQIRHRVGFYTLAKADYTAYLANPAPGRKEWEAFAQKSIEECDRAEHRAQFVSKGLLGAPNPYRADSVMNGEYSDFAATFQGDTITYTTFYMQKMPYRASKQEERLSLRILRRVGTGEPLLLGDSFNMPGIHYAYSAFTPDNSGVYYAVCEHLNAADMRCDLYYRKRIRATEWGSPLRLGVNLPQVTSTQPAVGVDASGKQWLFFASDRPGGKPGLDIWAGPILDNGDVSEAQNLTDINTDGDDLAPFFHTPAQQLYFSTDGRVGWGGLDVFQSQLKPDGSWGKVKETGSLINSSYDEVFFSLNADGDKALFSSNRAGATPILAEEGEIVCCYDIFFANIDLDVTLDAFTFQRQDSSRLSGSTITLYEITPEGERPIESVVNPDSNVFHFKLARNKKYRVAAQQKNYSPDAQILDLTDLDPWDNQLKIDLFQEKLQVSLQILLFDEAGHVPLPNGQVQLFEIRGQDTVKVGDLENSLSNDFLFEVSAGKPYLIVSNAQGYEPDTFEFEVGYDDIKRLGSRITVERELERIDFNLPILLYFDNSSPDGRSMSPVTKTEYASLNKAYYAQKNLYINRFTSGKNLEEVLNLEGFFEREVRDELKKLYAFSDQLLHYLGKGNSIEIELKGYSSPRAEESFNEILSRRRIMSVANFFRAYKNGQFLPYLENGQFKIIDSPFGETQSKIGVPDRLDDENGSIYSFRASLERRVEISKIKTQISKPPKK